MYILFNVVAGMSVIPKNEACSELSAFTRNIICGDYICHYYANLLTVDDSAGAAWLQQLWQSC